MRLPGGGRKGGGIGIFGILVLLGLMYFLGIDPRLILQGPGGGGPGGQGVPFPEIRLPQPAERSGRAEMPRRQGSRAQPPASTAGDDLKAFVAVVLADTEDVWHALFRQYGQRYQEPKLVLFTGATRSACGTGVAAMGPFYCPLDRKVYVDLSFYRELKSKFGAPGDFAQAYVIAHEVGHHVQTLLGIAEKVQRAKSGMSQRQANALQVRMELQADCLAGVWAKHANRTKGILQPGDIDEALNAASAIGDDRIQRRTQGRVVPDAFTHGTSAQRVRWFRRGFESGDMQRCDTFAAREL
ncbi:MAG: neutral zinc metallopeptidase [Methyloligellaceae bacterium]